MNAFQDAVILANVISELESKSAADIKAALESYQEQRLPRARFEYMNSKMISRLMTGQVSIAAKKTPIRGTILSLPTLPTGTNQPTFIDLVVYLEMERKNDATGGLQPSCVGQTEGICQVSGIQASSKLLATH